MSEVKHAVHSIPAGRLRGQDAGPARVVALDSGLRSGSQNNALDRAWLRLHAAFKPINDLESVGRKIVSACAAQEGDAVLLTATALMEVDIRATLRALRVPTEKLSAGGLAAARHRARKFEGRAGRHAFARRHHASHRGRPCGAARPGNRTRPRRPARRLHDVRRFCTSDEHLLHCLAQMRAEGVRAYVGMCCSNFVLNRFPAFRDARMDAVLLDIAAANCYELRQEDQAYAGRFQAQASIDPDVLAKAMGHVPTCNRRDEPSSHQMEE